MMSELTKFEFESLTFEFFLLNAQNTCEERVDIFQSFFVNQ